MSNWVLDASAVLALLNQEPGHEVVAQVILEGAVLSTVNLSEIVAKLADAGMTEKTIHSILDPLELRTADCDGDLAYQAGMLRPATRALGLSLGDRVCLALAQRTQVPVLTTDRAWASLALGITVQIVR